VAYRLETDETVPAGLRRCAEEQLDRAVQELTDGVKVDPVEAVHSARKALKMERSLLRLSRSALPAKTRRWANAQLRDAARRLSGARDADVMIEALHGLADRYAGQVPEATFTAIRERLGADRDGARAGLENAGEIAATTDDLRAVRLEVAGWRLRSGDWKVIEPGLRRGYTQGRRARERAQRRPTMENLHEWRKRVKDHWYHLRLLANAAPITLEGPINEAHALSDLLGDDHDLAVLAQTLAARAAEIPVDLGPVMGLIAHRREQLQQEAHFVGDRVYAEQPGAFARRLKRYWKASRGEARALAQRTPAEVAQATTHAPVVG
jgi:CHAD domain-containing protein